MPSTSRRKAVFDLLERSNKSDRIGRAIDIALIVLIAINIISVILETVDWINVRYAVYFQALELFSVAVFSVEYILRLWVCVENDALKHKRFPRLAYATSPLAVVDLVAILPFYLTFFFNIDLRFLRALRLLRIFKLARYSTAMTMLLDVLREEASAFIAGFFILIVLLILAASGVYMVEHNAQPEKFGSIPAAMWWAVATLTTVGYGDVTPVTPWGQLLGACVTVIGIGVAALPAGILASGLADQLHRKRDLMSKQFRQALEDGIIDEDESSELEALRKELGLSARAVEDILNDVGSVSRSANSGNCPHCGGVLH